MKLKDPFFKERAGITSGVKRADVINLFLMNIGLWLIDVLLHYLTNPMVEVFFRPIHTLILLNWFVRHSPFAYTQRGVLLMVALFFSVAYPFQANVFRSFEIETYLEIVLPFISNALFLILFLLERKKYRGPGSLTEALFVFFLYFVIPCGYYYFVIYQTLKGQSYFTLTIIYTIFFIAMLLTGSHLNMSKRNQNIVLIGLGLMVAATGINSYSIFIERIDYGYPFISFLSMMTPIFFLWGFANEDIKKKAGQLNRPALLS